MTWDYGDGDLGVGEAVLLINLTFFLVFYCFPQGDNYVTIFTKD